MVEYTDPLSLLARPKVPEDVLAAEESTRRFKTGLGELTKRHQGEQDLEKLQAAGALSQQALSQNLPEPTSLQFPSALRTRADLGNAKTRADIRGILAESLVSLGKTGYYPQTKQFLDGFTFSDLVDPATPYMKGEQIGYTTQTGSLPKVTSTDQVTKKEGGYTVVDGELKTQETTTVRGVDITSKKEPMPEAAKRLHEAAIENQLKNYNILKDEKGQWTLYVDGQAHDPKYD
jgi:hypothetical protein